MKIVIDIPDAEYERIQAMDWKNGDRWYSCETVAIHNGTPLPKGHGDLKDFQNIYAEGYDEAIRDVMKIIDEADKKAGDKTYIVMEDGVFYSQARYIKEKMMLEL